MKLTREHYTTGDIDHDIVGEFFKEVYDAIDDPAKQARSEINDFAEHDNRTSLLWYNNKIIAFVIEARNDFNNIDVIKGAL